MIHPDYNKNLFPHWAEFPIRYRDLDPLNHVNNAIFCTYFEEARVKFIADISAFTHSLQKGFSFVLANITIDFVQPVEYPAVLRVGSGIQHLGKTSISSFQAIYEKEKLAAVAQSTGVWFDLSKQQPANVPEIKNVEKFMVQV